MIAEEILDIVKNDVDEVYNLIKGHYPINKLLFGIIDVTINFHTINNYSQNFSIDKNGSRLFDIGRPPIYKERKLKLRIRNGLIKILELYDIKSKEKYDNFIKIKNMFSNFNPTTSEVKIIKDIFEKTTKLELANVINRTNRYLGTIYLQSTYAKYLSEFNETIQYRKITKIKEDILIKKILKNDLCIQELKEFNDILILNNIKTFDINNVEFYLTEWFKIFKTRTKLILVKMFRITNDFGKKNDWGYGTINYTTEHPNITIDYSEYITENISYTQYINLTI